MGSSPTGIRAPRGLRPHGLAPGARQKAPDSKFDEFFPLIVQYSIDERNFVKKAVNWALRQLGKRNLALNRKAIATARQIGKLDSKAARWIARDAIKELESDGVKNRLQEKAARARSK